MTSVCTRWILFFCQACWPRTPADVNTEIHSYLIDISNLKVIFKNFSGFCPTVSDIFGKALSVQADCRTLSQPTTKNPSVWISWKFHFPCSIYLNEKDMTKRITCNRLQCWKTLFLWTLACLLDSCPGIYFLSSISAADSRASCNTIWNFLLFTWKTCSDPLS